MNKKLQLYFLKIKKSELIKNSAVLIIGTVLAQLIPILLQPWLRRIYTPEEFGVFAIYTTLLGMVAAIASLKYDSTIVLPKHDKDATNLIAGSVLISIIISFILLLVIIIFGDSIIHYFNFPDEIKKWTYFLPVGVFLFANYQTFNYWLIRKRAYKISSINKVIRRTAEGSTQLILGNITPSAGLIIGNIVGDFINLVSGGRQLIKTNFNRKLISFNRIFLVLKRYKEFPIYSALPAFFNSISLTFPVLVVTKLFGEEITGQFNLSQMVLALPLALVSISVYQVVFQQTSDLIKQNKSIYSIFKKTFTGLCILSIPFMLILYFFSEVLFTLIFGAQWELAGSISKILVFSYALKFIVSPLSSVFTSLEKIKISSIWQISYFVSILGLLWVDTDNISTFFYIYLLIDLIMYSIYLVLILIRVKKYEDSRFNN